MTSKLLIDAWKAAHAESLSGQATDANAQDAMMKELFPIGYPFVTRQIATFKDVPAGIDTIVVPIPQPMDEPGTATTGVYEDDSLLIDYATIPVTAEIGKCLVWNRKFKTDALWGALESNLKKGAQVMEKKLFDLILDEFDSNVGANTFDVENSGTLSYNDIVNGCSILWGAEMTCDFVLVDEVAYASLLKDETLINSQTIGTTPARTGQIPTVLGCTIIMSTAVDSGKAYFISKDAITVAMKTDLSVETFDRPELDRYGAVLTMIYGLGAIVPEGIAIASI